MRLIEEYPDGVTEAIVVTELTALLQRRVHSSPSAISSNRKVVRGVEDMTRVLSELEEQDDAISARLVSYDGHKLSIQAEKSSDIKLEMYVWRLCIHVLSSVNTKRLICYPRRLLPLFLGTSTSASAHARRS